LPQYFLSGRLRISALLLTAEKTVLILVSTCITTYFITRQLELTFSITAAANIVNTFGKDPPFPLDTYPHGVYHKSMKSHYKDVKVQAEKRINIIKGQLDGLQKMIENDEYCINLLNQSLAIQNSLRSLDTILFERHLKTHVIEQLKHEEENAVSELVALFKRVNK